jgi:DTW domain-containing protein YfiP
MLDRFCVTAFRPSGRIASRQVSFPYNFRLQSSSSSFETSEFRGVSSSPPSPLDENFFLHQVEATVAGVLGSHEQNASAVKILDLPVDQREAFGVAKHLDKRLRSLRKNNDCPRCWMQRYHCICKECGPVAAEPVGTTNDIHNHQQKPLGSLRRIFLVVHHKEIGLKVDTAKLILAAFPFQCELVVGGIGPEHQASMKNMMDSIRDPSRTSLVLFPDETAETLEEIVAAKKRTQRITPTRSLSDPPTQSGNENEKAEARDDADEGYDLIVLDGTWAQARKFHSRYFPPSDDNNSAASLLQRVKLSEASVGLLQEGSTTSGHQLRRHDIAWRQVGTFEAFRLFLRDWSKEFPSSQRGKMEFWEQIESYQRIANEAALRELGPPRT